VEIGAWSAARSVTGLIAGNGAFLVKCMGQISAGNGVECRATTSHPVAFESEDAEHLPHVTEEAIFYEIKNILDYLENNFRYPHGG
jgi:hypothetical protein